MQEATKRALLTLAKLRPQLNEDAFLEILRDIKGTDEDVLLAEFNSGRASPKIASRTGPSSKGLDARLNGARNAVEMRAPYALTKLKEWAAEKHPKLLCEISSQEKKSLGKLALAIARDLGDAEVEAAFSDIVRRYKRDFGMAHDL